jgi:WD40 repeat protein
MLRIWAFCILGFFTAYATALDSNVSVTYSNGVAIVDVSKAKWASSFAGAEVKRCTTEIICEKVYFPFDSNTTFYITEKGLFEIDFMISGKSWLSDDLSFTSQYKQRIANLDLSPATLKVALQKYSPQFSFAVGEEYFPVSVDQLFNRYISDFSVSIVGGPNYSGTEKINDLMRGNGHIENEFFMKPNIAQTIKGNKSSFPTYWMSEKVSNTEYLVTYFPNILNHKVFIWCHGN